MERPKGSCGQKMRYREVGKKWREESSGILSELCLKMPYKVLMVCRGLPPWPFDDRTRTCLQSMISECSWFSNGIRYCEPQDSPARPMLWTTLKDQGNNGTESGAAAQRWRHTTLVFNEGAFSPLCDCGKIGTLKWYLWVSPRPAASDATEAGCWPLVSRSDEEWESFTAKHNLAQLFWSLWELTCFKGQARNCQPHLLPLL